MQKNKITMQTFVKEGVNAIFAPVIGLLFGFIVSALVIMTQDVNPLAAYKELFLGALGDRYSLSFTIIKFIPLAFAGLAVTFAYRGGMFNIGAEGQLYMGALVCTWFAVTFSGMPGFILMPLCIILGMAAGALWAAIPGYLKATRKFNEIINTILMNYIATIFVGLAVHNFLKEPGQTFPRSAKIVESAQLPFIIPGTRIHAGFILVFFAAVFVYFVLWRTTWGYEIRAVGANPDGARNGGVNVEKTMVLTMIVSGALASLAGTTEILGVQHRLLENFMVGYGFDAIAIALLGGLHPVGTLLAAFFFGALRNGANSMQIALGVPVSIVYMIQALAVLGVAGTAAIKTLANNRKRRSVSRALGSVSSSRVG
ncbi:ABC transporter permease [Zhaonella formicivorans]|uniref:ABC transporter permease n=1 Tax=Zhaonella formicivorans TaxID=2528593 RepID=UPI0010E5809B|nr:ABC transporter permease [Zhaonella formicivorans]